MSWRSQANLRWLRAQAGISEAVNMDRYTTFGIGGPADFFVEAGTAVEMMEMIPCAAERGIPYLVLGAGTNLLVADRGVAGLVVRSVNRQHMISGDRVWAESGLKTMRLARLVAAAGLSGFEFGIGVPGSVGGAIYQNAGCWGTEVSDVLTEAYGFLPDGTLQAWPAAELGLGYRTSALRSGALRGGVVHSAWFQLRPDDSDAIRKRMAELTRERRRSQPIASLNCGSVFKNPPGDSAGRLVEAAGLKGAREGAAQISEMHANFIVNTGAARAEDVSRLIERAQTEVRDRFGVVLETEVERVGRWTG